MLAPKPLDIEITAPPLKSATPIEYQNVLIQEVREILPHSNPSVERLEVVIVGGWRCLSQKGKHTVGEKVLFIPPDAILPEAYATAIGVANYLDKGSRVKTIKLRGEISSGIITAVPTVYAAKPVGFDLGEVLGITKYKPRLQRTAKTSLGKKGSLSKYEDTLDRPALCWLYPDTANLRHYPNNIPAGEAVVVTEKIHGCCQKTFKVLNDKGVVEYGVCSRNHRRRYPFRITEQSFWANPIDYSCQVLRGFWEHRKFVTPRTVVDNPDAVASDWWWHIGDRQEMRKMIDHLFEKSVDGQVIVYAESYGADVQKMQYGSPQALQYAVFDILIDGKFIPWDEVLTHCKAFGVITVPEMYRGPYNFDTVAKLADGKTIIGKDAHIREGVVVKTQSPTARQSYKYVSDSYLLYKDGKEELDTHSE